MATITPSKNKPDQKSRLPLTLVFLGILILFGSISFILMHSSKHLHDHDHAKPTLLREEEEGAAGATKGAVAEELSSIGAAHEEHKATLDLLAAKLLKNTKPAGDDTEKPITQRSTTVRSSVRSRTKHGNVRGTTSSTASEANSGGSSVAASNSNSNTTPRLHAVTYATHGGRDDRFCRAVESAIRNDYDLVILGWGTKWRGLSQKLSGAQAYAAQLPAEDILLFTDAFDVLFNEKPEVLEREYVKMGAELVFGAECGCWPHVIENKGRACFETYPKAPTPYRYLNSGTWIGRAAKASVMLLEVMKEAGSDFANANDQKLVADFYIAGRFGIKLDFYNKIFQSMHMTLDKPLPHCDPTQDVKRTSEGRFRNELTDSQPGVFHFNGGGKRVHLGMERGAWYKAAEHNTPDKKRALAAFMVSTPTDTQPDRRLRFDKICPTYFNN